MRKHKFLNISYIPYDKNLVSRTREKTRDKERDNLLEQKFGLKIIRYRNAEILNNADKVTEDLIRKVKYLTPP